MVDGRVRVASPIFLGPDLHHIEFDFGRVFFFRKAESAADAPAVCINDDTGHAETFAEDNIRSLAADAIELREFRLCFGHDAIVFVDNFLTRTANVLCLHTIEAAGLNVFLKFFWWGRDEVFGLFVFLEQRLGHDVDAVICTLCGEYCGNEQLQRRTVCKRADWIRVQFV